MEKKLQLVLVDDGKDDCIFFNKALENLTIPACLTIIEDGEKLMHSLKSNPKHLPDILFLNLNMPGKNGSECLDEIKQNKKLKDLPVIIYSTSLHEDVAELLYQKGAYYYIRITDVNELKRTLQYMFTLVLQKKFNKPPRDKFIFNSKRITKVAG